MDGEELIRPHPSLRIHRQLMASGQEGVIVHGVGHS